MKHALPIGVLRHSGSAAISAAVALLLAAPAHGGAAQRRQGPDAAIPPGGQVDHSPRAGRSQAVDQVSRRSDRAATSTEPTTRAASRPAVTQVAAPAAARVPASQITSVRRDARGAAQLSRGPATAAAPEALSNPAQGRRQSLERLGGRDRCDPQTTADPADRCARVIETRSGEFVRADPLVLSPEQRLLVDQRLREAPSGAQSAVQRVGKNEVDPSALDTQGLAALTLQSQGEAPVAPEAEPSTTQAAAAALVQAIVEGARSGLQPR